MIKRISALIWLRTQMILSNGAMLFQIVFPYGMLLAYDHFMNKDGNPQTAVQILFMMIPLALSLSVGNMITIMLAEEKEKKNLKTLFLSGIHSVVLAVITIVSFPMIVKADLSGRWMEYGAIVASVAICVILLNLLVGALTDTQAKAQVNGVIPMMGIAFLPMFSMLSDAVSKVTHYTFMGNFVDFFVKNDFALTAQSFIVPGVWIVVLLVLNFFFLKPKAKN